MEPKRLMSEEEARRMHVLKLVMEGRITLVRAAELIGVCYRQAKRLKKKFGEEGASALVHGNRARCPPNCLPEETRSQIVELASAKYRDFNDTHFTQMLASEEGINVSRETVRQILRAAGLPSKRRRRPRKHRSRRPRKPQEGMMVVWDGSPHQWFGPDRQPCCLMASVDDATGKLLAANFIPHECSHGYLLLLRDMISQYGVPLSIYQDCHGIHRRNDTNWSFEEELAGKRDPTQVGLALETLAIHPIFAHSPQAKGRIERAFHTLQDRLIPEMRLRGITTLQQANRFLQESFIQDYNRRYAISAQETQLAWRKPPKDLPRIISFCYHVTVANDNTAKLGGITIDIPPGPAKRSYAKTKVEVRQLLDGSWRVYYQEQLIAKHPSTQVHEPIRALRRRKHGPKATKESLWVYLSSADKIPSILSTIPLDSPST